MSKYAFLIEVQDNPPFWIDHDLSTSGQAVDIADTYSASGVVNITQDPNTKATIYHKYPATAINAINIYYPNA